jgi:hypothetical protein
MEWWELGLWGLFGGFIVDGLEFWRLVRNNRGVWPVQYRSFASLAAEIVRLIVGAGLAIAFGKSGQVTGAIGAVAIGAAAPLIVEKLAQQVPSLPTPPEENTP